MPNFLPTNRIFIMPDDPSLTFGIITCGRSEKVHNCLRSISNHASTKYKIVIVDSLISDEARNLYNQFTNCEVYGFDSPISPSAARAYISERLDTPFLLFLDDDIELHANTTSLLLRHLEENPEVDIVSAAWSEYGQFRELGQSFHFGTKRGLPVVYKSFEDYVTTRDAGITSLQVDAVHATMLLRANVLEKVQFDPEFEFFFELFDFFMQCRKEEIRIETITTTLFEHSPEAYQAITKRQTSPREQGEKLFKLKWGVTPIGALGNPPSKEKHFFKRLLDKL